jgi:DNA-binding IclR family transcriptional regulator
VAYDREAVLPGVCCVAVPVRTGNGRVLGSLALVTTSNRPLSSFVTELANAADAIAGALPGNPSEWRESIGERAVNP